MSSSSNNEQNGSGSTWKEKASDFFDDKVSMQTYKQLFSVKLDAFGDYEKVEDQIGHDKVSSMGYAIKDISKICFKQCIDVRLNDYPEKEQTCIRNCIESQLNGIHAIIQKFENYQSPRLVRPSFSPIDTLIQPVEILKQEQQLPK